MMADQCIFCKIVKKEIPVNIVYDDKDFLAFLDIMPRNEGHTLVIPKKHYKWVWDVSDQRYFEVTKKIAKALQKTYTEYVLSLVFGEEIHHAHIHLIPRFPNDGHGSSIDMKNIKQIPKEEFANIAEKIKKNL